MNAQQKKKIIELIENSRGDDLERARYAFSGLNEKEMQGMHGQSGKTRAEIFKIYEDHEANINGLIAAVEELP